MNLFETRLRATYVNGAFVPVPDGEPVELRENEEVEIIVSRRSNIEEPLINDPEERAHLLRELVERIKANPLPEGAPRRFTREELHERR